MIPYYTCIYMCWNTINPDTLGTNKCPVQCGVVVHGIVIHKQGVWRTGRWGELNMSKRSHFSKGFHYIMILKIFLVKDMVNGYYLISHRLVYRATYALISYIWS